MQSSHFRLAASIAAALTVLTPAGAQAVQEPNTELVSVSSVEAPADHSSFHYMFHPGISASGRFVAFTSEASNLDPDDDDGRTDVFLRDRRLGTTQEVSVSVTEESVKPRSRYPAISADGQVVSFYSSAHLVLVDANQAPDVFVRIPATGQTERVSVSTEEAQANSGSYYSALSKTGRYVAFVSYASNLVPDDTNGESDVFVRDRTLGTTERVSVGLGGAEANGTSESETLSISAGGRFVTFHSGASNLAVGDTDDNSDIFVYDRRTDVTSLVSVTSAGENRPRWAGYPTMSADGSKVAFASNSRLVPEDTDKRIDVYVHNLVSGKTVRASVDSDGSAANGSSGYPAISGDGTAVCFYSAATFSRLDPGNRQDIYLHRLNSGNTRLVTARLHENSRPGWSYYCGMNHDGSRVAFSSTSNDLVPEDSNSGADVFLRTYPRP